MKLFGHPVHTMLIHFPAALFPMEVVCYFIFYKTGNASFADAAFYAMIGGIALGWLSAITGVFDMWSGKDDAAFVGQALKHALVNAVVVVGYTILAATLYGKYPGLPAATMAMLLARMGLNALMLVGNYLGGKMVYS